MMGRMRLRPWEIMQMTFPEIVLALDDDVESRPRSGPGESQQHHGQVQDHARRWRAMTPEQRLEYSRQRYD